MQPGTILQLRNTGDDDLVLFSYGAPPDVEAPTSTRTSPGIILQSDVNADAFAIMTAVDLPSVGTIKVGCDTGTDGIDANDWGILATSVRSIG